MKTNTMHPFHGITLHASLGWAVQIKLQGKYRILRSYADNPEKAARHHDIALCILEAFTEPTSEPNFPGEFASVLHHPPTETVDNDESDFRRDVFALRDELTADAESAGFDVNEMLIKRHQDRELATVLAKAKRGIRYGSVMKALFKAQSGVFSLDLTKADKERVHDLIKRALEVLNASSNR